DFSRQHRKSREEEARWIMYIAFTALGRVLCRPSQGGSSRTLRSPRSPSRTLHRVFDLVGGADHHTRHPVGGPGYYVPPPPGSQLRRVGACGVQISIGSVHRDRRVTRVLQRLDDLAHSAVCHLLHGLDLLPHSVRDRVTATLPCPQSSGLYAQDRREGITCEAEVLADGLQLAAQHPLIDNLPPPYKEDIERNRSSRDAKAPRVSQIPAVARIRPSSNFKNHHCRSRVSC